MLVQRFCLWFISLCNRTSVGIDLDLSRGVVGWCSPAICGSQRADDSSQRNAVASCFLGESASRDSEELLVRVSAPLDRRGTARFWL